MTFSPRDLRIPIVQAPMAGGPSTVELAAAVSAAGGLGSLAAGGLSPTALQAAIEAVAGRTAAAFGVNLFARPGEPAESSVVDSYRARLAAEGFALGVPVHHDDALDEKVAVVLDLRPAVVSFTFGAPPVGATQALQEAGTAVWLTVTTLEEVALATAFAPDALVVQGGEAGGHRGSWDDAEGGAIPLLELLALARAETNLELVAAGGLATRQQIAGALAAGAVAAQLGTALMLTDEAGTAAEHRAALAEGGRPTGLTRAFTGRLARGIANEFQAAHDDAPSAYPEIHELTRPMRAQARDAGDRERLHLWAGESYELAQAGPVQDVLERLSPR